VNTDDPQTVQVQVNKVPYLQPQNKGHRVAHILRDN
jgi:hypothetical protein